MRRYNLVLLAVLIFALTAVGDPVCLVAQEAANVGAEVEADWMAQAQVALRTERVRAGVYPAAVVDKCVWIGTGLHAGGKQEPAWWQVDLGKAQPLDRAVISKREFRADRAARLQILLSEDGQQWKEVYRHDGTAVDRVVYVTVSLGGHTGRYVRVVVPPGDGVHLDEVQIYSSQGPRGNLALGKPTIQSDTIGLSRPRTMEDLVNRVLRRGGLLAKELRRLGAETAAGTADTRLAELVRQRDALAKGTIAGQDADAAWSALYLKARWAVRKAAFANPLLDFDELLFVRRHWPGGHQAAHHLGTWQEPGGDVSILTGLSPAGKVRSVIGDQLASGGIGRPDLSFDGERIVFPYAGPREPPTKKGSGPNYDGGSCWMYDVYEINVDGTGLRRLTNCPNSEDTEPCYLPNGRIAFTTSRENRFVQCGDWALALCIYTMAADGSDVRKVTDTKEGEYYPSVMDDGRLIYMRWEYVMKAFNTLQYLWTVYPDGTRAQLAYGDHFAFTSGPQSFIEPRQIPGTGKIVATATSHHGSGGGSICVLDLAQNRGGPEGFVNLTPEVSYPELNFFQWQSDAGWYTSPWPLSEKFFLVSYTPQVGHQTKDYAIYLMDSFGNKELIYRDKDLACYSPIPLRSRPRPAVLPGDADQRDAENPGTLIVADVYQGLPASARGTVKYLRVLESPPKEVRCVPRQNDMGVGSGWSARVVLGTVPVEPDGSAHFRVPPDRMIFLEALDEDFLEIRRMRSALTNRPGEVAACVGCHEPFGQAPPNRSLMAMERPARDITPPPWGVMGMDFAKVVQPVLDRHCTKCHDGSKAEGKAFDLRGDAMVTAPVWNDKDEGPQHSVSRSFLNLLPHVHYIKLGGDNLSNLPLEAYATGSYKSPLMRLLRKGHQDVKLTTAEWRALAAWIDCNAPYYGGWEAFPLTTAGF